MPLNEVGREVIVADLLVIDCDTQGLRWIEERLLILLDIGQCLRSARCHYHIRDV